MQNESFEYMSENGGKKRWFDITDAVRHFEGRGYEEDRRPGHADDGSRHFCFEGDPDSNWVTIWHGKDGYIYSEEY